MTSHQVRAKAPELEPLLHDEERRCNCDSANLRMARVPCVCLGWAHIWGRSGHASRRMRMRIMAQQARERLGVGGFHVIKAMDVGVTKAGAVPQDRHTDLARTYDNPISQMPKGEVEYIKRELGADHSALKAEQLPPYEFDALFVRFYNKSTEVDPILY